MAAKVDAEVERLAREVAVEAAMSADAVGPVVSVETDEHGYVLVRFAAALAGYRGWLWTVVLTSGEDGPAVCEAYLLPGDDALLAPAWIPWSDRVQPGDLDAAMVLPFIAEDPRLVPGYTATDEDDADLEEFFEWGLGRERVLAPEGRDGAAERWYRGSHGPTAASAVTATASCSTCAFYIPLSGSLRMVFGVCANEWSPSDGRVVSLDHGCGAHSQTDAERRASEWPAPDPIVDSEAIVEVDLQGVEPEADAAETDAVEIDAAATDAVAVEAVEAVESEADVVVTDAAEADATEASPEQDEPGESVATES